MRPAPTVATPPRAALAAGERVAELAASFVGTPYRYGGAAPGGFDCSGLVWYVHRALGLHRTQLYRLMDKLGIKQTS